MRSLVTMFAVATALFSAQPNLEAAKEQPTVAIVDFKQCAEDSKLGKQQQENFEGLKQQIQDVMSEKEKEIKDLADKFQDPDYLDSLSPEAENKLKQEFQQANMQYNQMQQQFFQTLQQANVQIVRLIADSVQDHAKTLAEEKKIDVVLNAESCFYFDTPYDLTTEVVSKMDATFEKEATESAE